jgi:hypothetical protein
MNASGSVRPTEESRRPTISSASSQDRASMICFLVVDLLVTASTAILNLPLLRPSSRCSCSSRNCRCAARGMRPHSA